MAWVSRDNQDIYAQYNSYCQNVFLSNLYYNLNSYSVCQGIQNNISWLVKHSVPKIFIPFQENEQAWQESIFYQSSKCSILAKTLACIGYYKKQKKVL